MLGSFAAVTLVRFTPASRKNFPFLNEETADARMGQKKTQELHWNGNLTVEEEEAWRKVGIRELCSRQTRKRKCLVHARSTRSSFTRFQKKTGLMGNFTSSRAYEMFSI